MVVVVCVAAGVVVSASVLAQPARNSPAAEATARTDNDLLFTCPLSMEKHLTPKFLRERQDPSGLVGQDYAWQ